MFPNKRGRKCYITHAFSGLPIIEEQNQKWLPRPCLLGGPKEGGRGDGNKSGQQKGGSAMSPLRSRGTRNKGTKSKVVHKWAEVLRNQQVARKF